MALVPARRLGMAFAVIFTGITLGAALGNFLAAPMVGHRGFGALGAGIIVVALLAIAAASVVIPGGGAAVARAGSQSPLAGYGAMLRRRTTLLLVAIQALPTVYYGAASLLMPLLIYRVARHPSTAAYYAMASLLFASASQLLTGRLFDRYGGKRLTVILIAMIAAVSLATAFLTGSLVGLFACGIMGIGLAWSLSVAYPVLINELMPPAEHGRALALLYVAWSVGMLVGTQTGGWLVDVACGLPFAVIGLANLGAAAGAVALTTRKIRSPIFRRRLPGR